MRNHSIDQRLGEFAHALCRRTKLPKIIDLVRPFAALEVTPEMILNCSFSSAPSFTHYPSAVWKPLLLVCCEVPPKHSKFPPLHARLQFLDSFYFQYNASEPDLRYRN